MAVRSFFCLYPALVGPREFRPTVAPPLLAQQELWEHSRACPPSLLFRVRSEADPGANLSTADRIESCVGMVDAATRWRVVFSMAHTAAAAVQHPQLRQAILQALAFVSSRHPASVTIDDRRAMLDSLGGIVHAEENKPHAFEALLAAGVAQLVQADNDIEAAAAVPFVRALCPFDEAEHRQEYTGRMATLETLSGAVLLTEAQRRLAERMPVWMVARMPELSPAGAEREEGDED